MHICYKGHKFTSKTASKDRIYLSADLKLILNGVAIVNSYKIDLIFFDEDPLFRFDEKGIDEIEVSSLVSDIYFFEDLSFEVNIVEPIDADANDKIFLLIWLIKIDVVEY